MLVLETGDSALARLQAALAAGDIASVVLRAPTGQVLDAAAVLPLIKAAQAKGVAALIEADAQLARTVKADGVHVPVSDDGAAAYADARETVGSGAIVGLDAGRSRHDAMAAGEGGADFVGFGIPTFVKDRDVAIEYQLDLVAWWAEIFEMPCVAFDVENAEAAADLAATGADFVALTLPGGVSPALVAEFVRAVSDAIREAAGPVAIGRSRA